MAKVPKMTARSVLLDEISGDSCFLLFFATRILVRMLILFLGFFVVLLYSSSDNWRRGYYRSETLDTTDGKFGYKKITSFAQSCRVWCNNDGRGRYCSIRFKFNAATLSCIRN